MKIATISQFLSAVRPLFNEMFVCDLYLSRALVIMVCPHNMLLCLQHTRNFLYNLADTRIFQELKYILQSSRAVIG